MSMATVIGPTPPGTGVIQAARAAAGANSTSPQSVPSGKRLMESFVRAAVAAAEAGLAGGRDQHLGLAHMVLEVGREAVGDGGRRAHQKQFQRHRATDDVRGADDDAVAALHRHADVLEHPHHAIGRAGADQRVALGKAADVVRVEAVDILAWVDALDHLGLADVLGQR